MWDLIVSVPDYCLSFYFTYKPGPGAVARSEAWPLGMQAIPSSIPTSGIFFREDLVMKQLLRPFSLFRWFKKSSCQLLAKECALNTGKCLGGLPRNSVVRVTRDLELIQPDPISCHKNQKGKIWIDKLTAVYEKARAVNRMNSSFPDRWSFSYLNLTEICHSHNRWTKV